MIIFRFHRGLLADSMETAKEFQTEEEMKEYIVSYYEKEYGFKLLDVDDIVINEETMNDDRIGWKDTRYVYTKRFMNENYMEKYGSPQCIGMCATEYPNSKKRKKIKPLYLMGLLVFVVSNIIYPLFQMDLSHHIKVLIAMPCIISCGVISYNLGMKTAIEKEW